MDAVTAFNAEADFCDALADLLEPTATASHEADEDASFSMLRGQAILARQIGARLRKRARNFPLDDSGNAGAGCGPR